MRAAPRLRRATGLAACHLLLAASAAAQCPAPVQTVPNQTISSGSVRFRDVNSLAASAVTIQQGAAVEFVAGNCIQLQAGPFRATAGTAATTFHAWTDPAPVNISVWPSSGSGLNGSIVWTAASPSGYGHLADMLTVINTTLYGAGACYVLYRPSTDQLWLRNDAGSDWLGGFTAPSTGTAENSQCRINGASSSVSRSGHQIAVTVGVNFKSAWAGEKNMYLLAFDNAGLNSGWQDMGTWTVTQSSPVQYYLTSSAGPGGTITPASGWYASGSVLEIRATANPGYQFSVFSGSLSGPTNPQDLTIDGSKSVTASFTAQQQQAPPLTLPTPLKGFTYFPRGHAWWDMLYHWYDDDCATSTLPASCVANKKVWEVVSSDLQMLAANGVNFIHLYLWDQDLVVDTKFGTQPAVLAGVQEAGFTGWDNGGPENSPRGQWNALADFVNRAKTNNLWVMVHIAAHRPEKKVLQDPANESGIGTDYGSWVNKFIDRLAPYQNVLIWDADWDIFQFTASAVTRPFWRAAYPAIAGKIQAHPYSNPAGRALLAVEMPFHHNPPTMQPRPPGGYQWPWQEAQRAAYNWRQVANAAGTYPPDLYATHLWNAHTGDIQANLKCAAGIANNYVCPTPASTCGANCTPVPLSQVVITEFGTGSSLEAAPVGNGTAFFGDAWTPTTTAAGQREYLMESLCVLKRLGINKYAYHGLYDSRSFWDTYFSFNDSQLAWLGFGG